MNRLFTSTTKILKIIGNCEQRQDITSGGAKMICGHPDAVKWATKNKQVNKKDKDDRYHWRHWVIKDHKKIPGWCPLKNGSGY